MAVDTQAKIEKQVDSVAGKIDQQVDAAAGKIDQQVDAATAEHPQISQAAGKLMLASIGAVGLASDALENLLNRAVERGEESRKAARRRMRELRSKRPDLSRQGINKLGETVRDTAELPSKSDIQSLHDQIAELSAKVDKLNKEKLAAPKPAVPGQ